jgi:hypothetical protein
VWMRAFAFSVCKQKVAGMPSYTQEFGRRRVPAGKTSENRRCQRLSRKGPLS